MPIVYENFPPREDDSRMLDAPTYQRNHLAILDVIKQELPVDISSIIEIGSGTGQHACLFAQQFSDVTYLPTDISAENRDSIAAWTKHLKLENILPPVAIDLIEKTSNGAIPFETTQAILCFNVIHIAPFAATQGLVRFAEENLDEDGKLILYGPYNIGGKFTSNSNEAFDKQLKSKNSEWGIRDIEALDKLANNSGLRRIALHEMPANNFMPVYERA